MPSTAPDWLTLHGGTLRLHPDGQSWFVLIGGEPQYLLRPVPAAGKFGCLVEQAVNGKRLDSNSVSPTKEEALRAGLEDLRKHLGW